MTDNHLNRRAFLGKSVTTVGVASFLGAGDVRAAEETASDEAQPAADLSNRGGAAPQTDMPCGMIGKLKISRMILGSNLMGGYSHSRDLAYVGPLMQAYNTQEKIMETLALAEAAGINTISQGDSNLIRKYNTDHGGHIQQLGPLHIREEDSDESIKTSIKRLIDQGPAAIYIFGHDGDLLVRAGRVDIIAKALQWVRDEGLPAGVGGHSLHVVVECEKHEVAPDFYFKTFHSDRYWSRIMKEYRDEYCWYNGASSEPGHYHDNMWCMDPEQTAEVMLNVKAAWIAFKVLAAGALHPKIGFRYALRNGADFLVVGMFDFQVKDNAELMKQTLASMDHRDRPWRA